MSILALLAASALSIPKFDPTAIRDLVARREVRTVNKNRAAAARIEVIIGLQGEIASCKPIFIVGDRAVGREICTMQQPRYWSPATGQNGQPVHGVGRTYISFYDPETVQGDAIRRFRPPPIEPDIELTVNKLPKGKEDGLMIGLLLEIESGLIVDCQLPSAEIAPPPFDRLACEGARQLKFDDVRLDGRPLQHFAIRKFMRFVTEAAGQAK